MDLQSQTSVLSNFFMPESIEKTIIREYVSPYTISYIKTKKDSYFCYSEETNTSVLLKIDKKSNTMSQSTVRNPYTFGFTTDSFNSMTAAKQSQKISIDCEQ